MLRRAERFLDESGVNGGSALSAAGPRTAPRQRAGARLALGARRATACATRAPGVGCRGARRAAARRRLGRGVDRCASRDVQRRRRDAVGPAVRRPHRRALAGARRRRRAAPRGAGAARRAGRRVGAGRARRGRGARRGGAARRRGRARPTPPRGGAESALRDALRAAAEAADGASRSEWLIARRREAPQDGPEAVRRAELLGDLRAEQRLAERIEREREERARNLTALRDRAPSATSSLAGGRRPRRRRARGRPRCGGRPPRRPRARSSRPERPPARRPPRR